MIKQTTRGRPKVAPNQKRQARTLMFTPEGLRRVEIAAIKAGFVTSTGRPRIGAWIESLSE